MADDLRFIDTPPSRAPRRVARTLFAAAGSVGLTVKVSARDGVTALSFGFDGAPVGTSHDTGTFRATPGRKALLEWVMLGAPGGTMKVVVTRDDNDATIATRERSVILPPFGEGYDALEIRV